MRIALYSPYLPKHRGGGEKYLLDVAAVLLAQGHQVSLALSSLEPINQAVTNKLIYDWSSFIGQDLTGLILEACPLNTSASWWQKLAWTAKFDCLYYQTDGSLFFSLAKKNILHLQIPFSEPKTNLVDRLKLWNWAVKNTNSEFTKAVIEKAWRTKVQFVHYPMILPGIAQLSTEYLAQKKPYILNVGRFFRQLHCKHQEVLIAAFKQLLNDQPKLIKSWELICLGSIEDQAYADQLHQLAKGWPIKFVHQANRSELSKYYQEASIYWHATGFGENEVTSPEKMEHFGISTVEAMSAGVAPIVIRKGGQKEIMTGELADWTWENPAELVTKTAELIRQPKLLLKIQQLAHQRAQTFNRATFSKILSQMIG